MKLELFLLTSEIFLAPVPLAENLLQKRQEVKDMLIIMMNERDTYTSFSASSNRSRLFSHVGCQIGMSKCFTMKGHIALSRVRNVKTLSRKRKE
jgi:hypothetical protein